MYYAIGDIHGRLDKLIDLDSKLSYGKKDTLVFLGDYIDRGPDSKGVINFLINLRDNMSVNCIFLKGNHELMLIDYLSGIHQKMFLFNGGNATVESYGAPHTFTYPEIPKEHLQFFHDTKLYYETDSIIFVHGCIPQEYESLSKVPEEILLWDRNYPWVNPEKRVVFGHTPFKKVYQRGMMLGIDTGATFGGSLTCAILNEQGDLQKLEYSFKGK
jgi:serine/threonine protein phosphatase 1